MNDKDEFELEKRRLTESVRQTVEQEMKRRYSWIGFGLAIIMGSLITLTVNQILNKTQLNLAKAEGIQEMATKNLVDVALRSEELAKQFEQYQKKITGLNKIVASITEQLKQATETNLQYSSGLREEISSLSAVLAKLAAKPHQEDTPKIKEDIKKIDGRLEKSKVSIEKSKKTFLEDIARVQKQIHVQQKPTF